MSLKEATYQATLSYLSAFEDHELRNLKLYDLILDEVHKGLFEAVLKRCSHNQSWAADVLGLARNTFRAKVDQGLNKKRKSYHRRSFLKE